MFPELLLEIFSSNEYCFLLSRMFRKSYRNLKSFVLHLFKNKIFELVLVDGADVLISFHFTEIFQ